MVDVSEGKPTNSRNPDGTFAKGGPGGPGRPPRLVERHFLQVFSDSVSLEDWRKVVESAVQNAVKGDAKARDWLGRYLLGNDRSDPTPLKTNSVLERRGIDVETELNDLSQSVQAVYYQQEVTKLIKTSYEMGHREGRQFEREWSLDGEGPPSVEQMIEDHFAKQRSENLNTKRINHSETAKTIGFLRRPYEGHFFLSSVQCSERSTCVFLQVR